MEKVENSDAEKRPLPQPPGEPAVSRVVVSGSGLQASWRSPWFWLVLFTLLLGGWQWWSVNKKLARTQQELAKRLQESDRLGRESHTLATKALEQMVALQREHGVLAERLADFQGQASALQALYQDGAGNRDAAVLAEVEQGLGLASQQLQLAGNVAAAILILQGLDSRLAQLDRPQFLGLRKALLRDLEALRNTGFVDVAGMNLRLEHIMTGLDSFPLILDPMRSLPVTGEGAAVSPERSWWQVLVQDAWSEVRGLVRIRRFDAQEPVLLQPEQSLMLRENLRLRLLNARLALLSRDQWTFRNELKAANTWMTRYFSQEDKSVLAALATLQQLSATEISVPLPSLSESMSILQGLKSEQERH